MTTSIKTCFKCNKIKSISDFYKHEKMRDGHLNKCIECAKADVRNNRAENIEHYRAFDNARANLPHRIEARKKYINSEAGKRAAGRAKRRWTSDNSAKRIAIDAVSRGLRGGKITKPSSCGHCGKVGVRIEGHHTDYARPLDVSWLCSGCHRNWHKVNGQGFNAV